MLNVKLTEFAMDELWKLRKQTYSRIIGLSNWKSGVAINRYREDSRTSTQVGKGERCLGCTVDI